MRSCHVMSPTRILIVSSLLISILFAQQNTDLKYAENLLRARNYESALKIFQKHYQKGNTSIKVINGLSRCLEELSLIDKWIDFLKSVTLKLPGSFNFQVDLGRAYFLNQDLDKAIETWESVYKYEPASMMRFRLVGRAMARVQLIDEAIDVYKMAIQKIKNQDALNLEIANLYRIQLNYEEATKYYLAYFNTYSNQQNYIRSLLLNMANDTEATERIIQTIQDYENKDNPRIKEMLSQLYMRNKSYSQALDIILQIEGNNNKSQYNYLKRFAAEAMKDNAWEYVILAYENLINLVDIDKKDEAELKLADAYFKSALFLYKDNQKKNSEAQIKKSLLILNKMVNEKATTQYQAAELSGDIYKLYYNDLDQALINYKRIDLNRITTVNSDRLHSKMGDIFIFKNNLEAASNQFIKIKTKNYKSFASYNLAEILYFSAQFSKAKKAYQELLLQIGMQDSLANNILDRIFQIDSFSKDSLNYAKFCQAALLKRQDKLSEAAKIFTELFNTQNITSFSSGIEAAKLYNKLNKDIESIKILENLIDGYPDEERIDYAFFMLANNHNKNRDYGRALALYQEILVRFPTSFYFEEARINAREINDLIKSNLN